MARIEAWAELGHAEAGQRAMLKRGTCTHCKVMVPVYWMCCTEIPARETGLLPRNQKYQVMLPHLLMSAMSLVYAR